MEFQDFSRKYCVIGGGPSGLTAVKNLKQWGIPCDAIEREDDLGGNWYYGKPNSSVYESTHLISSKRMTEYVDYPMPDDYPPYPSHRQVLQYLRGYAKHFDLYSNYQFNCSVESITQERDRWLVQIHGESLPRLYAGVIIANGHHWKPKQPTFPGEFSGKLIHSHEYKTPDVFSGKNVLVIGAGNSGCDIAVEAAIHAKSATISMRRGYHFVPKFIRGKPTDVVGDRVRNWPIPQVLQRMIAKFSIQWALGKPEKYGLPEPDHELFQTHPIINSQLPYYVGHGKIQVRPNIKRLRGNGIEFEDGTQESFDLVVCATGYEVSFPFIDPQYLHWQDGAPKLYLHAFHPKFDNLFISGMIQPNSGQWGLTDLQAQLIARYIVACRTDIAKADWFRALKHTSGVGIQDPVKYLESDRHRLEVDYFQYRETVKKLIARFGDQQALTSE